MARPIPKDEVDLYKADIVWLETRGSMDAVPVEDIVTYRGLPYSVMFRSFWHRIERMMETYGTEWRLWEVNLETVGLHERWELPWN